jgi:hypothetical protein
MIKRKKMILVSIAIVLILTMVRIHLHNSNDDQYFELDISMNIPEAGTLSTEGGLVPAFRDFTVSVVPAEGYEFVGWHWADDDGKLYLGGFKTMVDGQLTFLSGKDLTLTFAPQGDGKIVAVFSEISNG